MGNRPTRLARAETQFTLIGQVIDLEHHAVDFISQRLTPLADAAVVSQAFIGTFGQFQFATDRHTPVLQGLKNADMRLWQLALHLTNAVAAEFQRTAGGNFRIQLAQAAGSRITRIGESLTTLLQLPCIQRLETGLGHKDFATHFQHRRPALALQL